MKAKAKLVVYKDDSFLLLRKKTDHLRYVLLGGTLKKREQPKKACLREAMEEGNVDCKLKDITFLTSAIEKLDGKFAYSYYFITSQVSNFQLMEPHKFYELNWVHKDEALPFMREADRHILQRFLDSQKKKIQKMA
ncbi:MAG: NUDIX hydrolase [Flavobacteriales bacterium]|nr:NUDIX hydrolase [Flavobacteriales bacterium]